MRQAAPAARVDRMRDLSGLGLFIGGACLASLAVGLRVELVDPRYDARIDRERPDVLQSPGIDLMQMAALQHPLAFADFFWLSIVQEIGRTAEGHTPDPDRLLRWSQIATDLDPWYVTVYYATAVNLTVYNRNADKSDRLLNKGTEHIPKEWKLPFLLGYNDYFIRGDAEAASKHWQHAATLPRRPRFLLSLSARARYQAGDERGAIGILEDMIPHLTGPAQEDAILRLKAFRSEPILAAYDAACRAHQAATGETPDPKALHADGKVDAPPKDLYGADIYFDEGCIARTEYIKIREEEAKDNVGSQSPTSPMTDDLDIQIIQP